MSLAFPNSSRSYDATRHAVRFWGHDTAMEWSFFVTAEELRRDDPEIAEFDSVMISSYDSKLDRSC